jgi:hypothetical protein
MEIKLGHLYRDRAGRVVEVAEAIDPKQGGHEYSWIVHFAGQEEHYYYWTEGGFFDPSKQPRPQDAVEDLGPKWLAGNIPLKEWF